MGECFKKCIPKYLTKYVRAWFHWLRNHLDGRYHCRGVVVVVVVVVVVAVVVFVIGTVFLFLGISSYILNQGTC